MPAATRLVLVRAPCWQGIVGAHTAEEHITTVWEVILLTYLLYGKFGNAAATASPPSLLTGNGWEVERLLCLQDNALAIVDEAASGELICLRLAD